MEALVARLRTELGTDLRNASERIMILEQELARERAAREHVGPPHFSASAVSRVAGPAPMKVFTGARDATEIATWVIDAKERIYEPLQEEAAASGRTWAASSERLAVRTAATYLEGDAKAWYVHLAQKPETFSDFLGELTARFRPMDFAKRARDQLAETRQGDKSVEDYVVAFDSLCLKIPDIGSAEKLDRFVRGLNERVRIEVLLRQPSTYEDGLTKALDVDSVLKTGQRRIGGPSFGSGSDGRAPMELGAAEQMQKKKKMKFKKKRRGRKSRQNDVCHACKKKGHWQRDCPDAEADGVELELLHAEPGMAGEKALSLVKRNVSVDGVPAVAVVDTGATNTFLSYSLCLREGIKVVKRATLAVRLANGSVTRARGTARVVIGMAGFRNARLTAIVHSGKHDVILGLDWLRAQGASLRVGGQEFLQTEVVCLNKIDHEVRTRSGAARNGVDGGAESLRQDSTRDSVGSTGSAITCEESDSGDDLSDTGVEGVKECSHDIMHMPASKGCGACALGKITRKRAVRRKDQPAVAFNFAVSVDLVDPTEVGVDGTRWMFVHRDVGTGWIEVRALSDKRAESALVALKESQRGKGWPRLVKSDGGGEFEGAFEDTLRNNLVAHERGVARRANTHAGQERVHRDLNATLRVLLLQSGLPTTWFAFAGSYWAVARNLTWTGRASDKTPFEKRYGREWVGTIPPFGCGVSIYSEFAEKYEPNGICAVVVGIKVPETEKNDTSVLNVLAVPVGDLRPAAARWVAEWKSLPDHWPVRRLGLRAADETPALVLSPERGDPHEFTGVMNDAPVARVGSPGDGRTWKRAWSEEECAAVRDGYERLGPKWARIKKESGDILVSRSSKDVRSKAQALGLLGPEAQGLAEHRRGKSGAARRERVRTASTDLHSMVREALVTEVIDAEEAMQSRPGRLAFEKELKALRKMGALPLEKAMEKADADRVPGSQFVKLKAIFAIKNAELGIDARRHKCRLVAQGCVVKNANGRLVVDPFAWEKPPGLVAVRAAISAAILEHGDEADGGFLDVDNAYVHAKLGGPPTFVELGGLLSLLNGCVLPGEFRKLEKMRRPVVRLPFALYGMPRSGSDFGAFARKQLLGLGWREVTSDKNLYVRRRGKHLMWAVLYVDDGGVFGHRLEVRAAVDELKNVFRVSKQVEYVSEASKKSPVRFLGVGIYRDAESHAWVLDSWEYAKHVAADIEGTKKRATPLVHRPEPDKEGSSCGAESRKKLGQLLWLVRTTRPDLAFAVGTVARCTDRWSQEAEKCLTDILRYIRDTADVHLEYAMPRVKGLEPIIICYSDADLCEERSTTGICAYMCAGGADHIVDWSSSRQRRTATSTAESELIALHTAVQHRAFPLATFVEESRGKWPRMHMKVDNETALGAVEKGWSEKMLHLPKMQKISLRWLHEVAADGLAVYEHVKSRDNLADGFTKILPADAFNQQKAGWHLVMTPKFVDVSRSSADTAQGGARKQ